MHRHILETAQAPQADYGAVVLPEVNAYPLLPQRVLANAMQIVSEIGSVPERLAVGSQVELAFRDSGDPQSVREAVFVLDDTLGIPQQYVAITKNLLTALERAVPQRLQSGVWSLLAVPFEQRPEHLTGFGGQVLNRYNQLYFSLPGAHTSTPSIFNKGALIAAGASQLLMRNMPPSGEIRVKEIFCGDSWQARWQYFAQLLGSERTLNLTVSDFHRPKIKGAVESIVRGGSLLSLGENMLERPLALPESQKLHAIVSMYGFDSVWFPSDRTILKTAKIPWCEALFRVAVPDWHPRAELLKHAFQSGEVAGLDAHDFRKLIVERVLRPITFDDEPALLPLLEQRLDSNGKMTMLVPAGIVNFICNAFETQLADNGIFMIGDVGINDPGISVVHDVMTTGVGAKFHGVDFVLIRQMLEQRGFKVEVRSLKDLVGLGTRQATRRERVELEGVTHTWLMTVRRSGAD